jgi:hypothetical protein
VIEPGDTGDSAIEPGDTGLALMRFLIPVVVVPNPRRRDADANFVGTPAAVRVFVRDRLDAANFVGVPAAVKESVRESEDAAVTRLRYVEVTIGMTAVMAAAVPARLFMLGAVSPHPLIVAASALVIVPVPQANHLTFPSTGLGPRSAPTLALSAAAKSKFDCPVDSSFTDTRAVVEFRYWSLRLLLPSPQENQPPSAAPPGGPWLGVQGTFARMATHPCAAASRDAGAVTEHPERDAGAPFVST